MSLAVRITIALTILVVDLVTVAVPLMAFFVAYVIVFRPKKVLQWVAAIYREEPA